MAGVQRRTAAAAAAAAATATAAAASTVVTAEYIHNVIQQQIHIPGTWYVFIAPK